ncbi:MAG: hypothetical protein A3D27_01010 [Omnitrophica WOR_2 bacterium RIFCSPHIGHO2_02_FULL_46_37]|nr:MAG: hypothetical protein A3D27_01010 [Omnitrophica WOR_2 bacterium RIFCSPHIGHO2_02_FULL_46_37]
MLKVAVGRSRKKDIAEAVEEATRSCLLQLPAQEVSLALVFSTPSSITAALLKKIKSGLRPDCPLIGCSGMRIITPEGTQGEGLVLMLIALPKVKISCGSIKLSPDDDAYLAGQGLGIKLISNVKEYRRELCLMFSDGLSEAVSRLMEGLQNILGKSFPFIGGGASDDLRFKQTFQFYNEHILNKSAVAALFAGKLAYGIGIRHGWKPLGKIRAITDSSANVIKKIDGGKASGLYEDYFAKTLAELKKEILPINTLYPIGMYLEGEKEYLLRNVIALNDDGSIVTQGGVPRGSAIRLMIGTKESCLEAARQAAAQVKAALRDKPIGLAIIISSASRAYLLGRNIDAEIKAVKTVLGPNVPLAGFYSYGQYAPLGALSYYGQTYLHNQTIAILGVGE